MSMGNKEAALADVTAEKPNRPLKDVPENMTFQLSSNR